MTDEIERTFAKLLSTSSSPPINGYVLPNTGYLRLPNIIKPHGPIPVCKSAWWAGVKAGRFPKPVKLGPKTTAWRVADIQRLIDEGVGPYG